MARTKKTKKKASKKAPKKTTASKPDNKKSDKSKSDKIRAALTKNNDANPAALAKRYGCKVPLVYAIKKELGLTKARPGKKQSSKAGATHPQKAAQSIGFDGVMAFSRTLKEALEAGDKAAAKLAHEAIGKLLR